MSDRYFPITRRTALGLSAVAAAAFVAPGIAFAQRKSQVTEVPLDELMKAGQLPDQVIGSANAKVTVVEYASMTCGHCAAFHNTVFPKLKEKYVDTGKVRFIMREFPLDDLAAAASMLARCAGGSDAAKSFDLTSILFAKQEEWAFVRGNPVPKLFEIAKQVGFTQESFDKCLTDQKLLEQISAIRERASKQFGVNSTPSFFINGKKLGEAPTVEAFEKALEPLLKAS